MFDSGFSELMLIMVVALVVVGPERLPGLARKVGYWVGRIRRYASTVRAEIEREINADELRSMLNRQEDELRELRDMLQDTRDQMRSEVDGLADAVSGSGQDAGAAHEGQTPEAGVTEGHHLVDDDLGEPHGGEKSQSAASAGNEKSPSKLPLDKATHGQ